MTKSIKLVAIFMALLMGFASLPVAQGVDNHTEESAQEAIIKEYFDCIDRADWDGWISCAAPTVRDRKVRLVSNADNHRNNRGILTISDVTVLDIEQLTNDYAPAFYTKLNNFLKDENSYACYRVHIDTKVYEDNGYFSNGESYHIVLLVKENDSWYVGEIYRGTSSSDTKGIGLGLIPYTAEPTHVLARDEKYHISTVPFSDFIFNVLCNEIGNMGYDTDAVYANTIAIKMATWWAVAGRYHESDGYDIGNGDVTYMSINRATAANQLIMRSAVNAMDNYCMVSSVGTGGKLFFPNYYDGQANTSGKGSGILSQNGSNYLATKKSYGWKKILRYYYDNSVEDDGTNIGAVQILCIGSHNWGSYNSSNSNSSTHWRICTRCEAKNSASHVPAGTYQSNDTVHWKVCSLCSRRLTQAHTWVQYPRYYKCSVCGRMQQVIPGTQSLSK